MGKGHEPAFHKPDDIVTRVLFWIAVGMLAVGIPLWLYIFISETLQKWGL